MLHFFFYGILTFAFPHMWWIMFLIGAAWEGLEYVMNKSVFTKCSKPLPARLSLASPASSASSAALLTEPKNTASLYKDKDRGRRPRKEKGDTTRNYKWWYARWQDIVMNALGIVVGYTLARLFYKKKDSNMS